MDLSTKKLITLHTAAFLNDLQNISVILVKMYPIIWNLDETSGVLHIYMYQYIITNNTIC